MASEVLFSQIRFAYLFIIHQSTVKTFQRQDFEEDIFIADLIFGG